MRGLSSLLVMVTVLVPAVASAATPTVEERAEQLTREGIALGHEGKLEEAIARFAEAQRLYPRPNNDCNIGLAYAQLSRWLKAWTHLDACKRNVRAGLPEWVQQRLDESADKLRAALYAPVTIATAPPGARVVVAGRDADAAPLTPATLWLPLGARTITVEKAGFVTARRDLQLDSVAATSVEIALEPVVAPALAHEQPARPRHDGAFKAGLGLAGAGVALGGVSLALYLVARDVSGPAANQLVAGSPAFQHELGVFHGEYWSSIALFSVAVVAIAGGATLAVWARPRRDRLVAWSRR